MTYGELREYVKQYKGDADNVYLIEAIADHCPDPETRDLIYFWFNTKDEE
jgi:hypothetical protein